MSIQINVNNPAQTKADKAAFGYNSVFKPTDSIAKAQAFKQVASSAQIFQKEIDKRKNFNSVLAADNAFNSTNAIVNQTTELLKDAIATNNRPEIERLEGELNRFTSPGFLKTLNPTVEDKYFIQSENKLAQIAQNYYYSKDILTTERDTKINIKNNYYNIAEQMNNIDGFINSDNINTLNNIFSSTGKGSDFYNNLPTATHQDTYNKDLSSMYFGKFESNVDALNQISDIQNMLKVIDDNAAYAKSILTPDDYVKYFALKDKLNGKITKNLKAKTKQEFENMSEMIKSFMDNLETGIPSSTNLDNLRNLLDNNLYGVSIIDENGQLTVNPDVLDVGNDAYQSQLNLKALFSPIPENFNTGLNGEQLYPEGYTLMDALIVRAVTDKKLLEDGKYEYNTEGVANFILHKGYRDKVNKIIIGAAKELDGALNDNRVTEEMKQLIPNLYIEQELPDGTINRLVNRDAVRAFGRQFGKKNWNPAFVPTINFDSSASIRNGIKYAIANNSPEMLNTHFYSRFSSQKVFNDMNNNERIFTMTMLNVSKNATSEQMIDRYFLNKKRDQDGMRVLNADSYADTGEGSRLKYAAKAYNAASQRQDYDTQAMRLQHEFGDTNPEAMKFLGIQMRGDYYQMLKGVDLKERNKELLIPLTIGEVFVTKANDRYLDLEKSPDHWTHSFPIVTYTENGNTVMIPRNTGLYEHINFDRYRSVGNYQTLGTMILTGFKELWFEGREDKPVERLFRSLLNRVAPQTVSSNQVSEQLISEIYQRTIYQIASEKYDWNLVDKNAFVRNLADKNNFTDEDLTFYNELILKDNPTKEQISFRLFSSIFAPYDIKRKQFDSTQITYDEQGNQSIVLSSFRNGEYYPMYLYEQGSNKDGLPILVEINPKEAAERTLRTIAYLLGKEEIGMTTANLDDENLLNRVSIYADEVIKNPEILNEVINSNAYETNPITGYPYNLFDYEKLSKEILSKEELKGLNFPDFR